MKTLHKQVLVYDKDCALCSLYTSAFLKAGMLDSHGRQNFCELDLQDYPQIDTARSRDEIALIDTQTGNVSYGIDSLFKIIGNSIPVFQPLFRLFIFRWLMDKLYSFISLNRKVIAPAKIFEQPGSCTPSYNLRYRWAYIILSWIFTSVVLTRFATRLADIVPPTDFIREWLICGGQILFQLAAVNRIRKDRVVHYLGNMMTVSNIGALLLIPPMWLNVASPLFYVTWFAGVVMFMLFEHNRRASILKLSVWVSVSWVVYRLIVLAIIFFL